MSMNPREIARAREKLRRAEGLMDGVRSIALHSGSYGIARLANSALGLIFDILRELDALERALRMRGKP